MRVRFLVSIASADWSYVPQQEVDIDDELARRFIVAGHCEPVTPAVETATAPATAETADQPKARTRRAK